MWTDSETMKCFFNTCWLLLLLTVKIALRVTNFQLIERDSEGHKAVVSDSEVHKADEVTEVRLVGEVDDELDEVSEVDYDEICEVGEADECL